MSWNALRPFVATVVAVLAAAVISLVLYEIALGVSHGSAVRWQSVVEGLLTGGTAIVVWRLARSRGTAAVGLVVAALLVGLAVADPYGHTASFAHSPMGWAVLAVLAVRLATPRREGDTAEGSSGLVGSR